MAIHTRAIASQQTARKNNTLSLADNCQNCSDFLAQLRICIAGLCPSGHNPAMSDPLEEHFGYLADRVKIERYKAAIGQAVRPGHIVLDLGCGSGLLGLMALRAGADKVLFIEEGSIIEVARRTLELAGFSDRAEFFKGRSYALELPEKADVVLCDHIGYFGFDYDVVQLLADARERLLRAGGVVVPGAIDIKLAPVASPNSRERVQRWQKSDVPHDFAWIATPAAHAKHAVDIQASELIADPAMLDTLDLGLVKNQFFRWTASFVASNDATLDGLAGWFDCVLHGNVRMTNAPDADDKIDRPQAFLPLEKPVEIRAGQRIDTTIMARPHDYILTWTIELPDTGAKFEHSTFNSALLNGVLRETVSRGNRR